MDKVLKILKAINTKNMDTRSRWYIEYAISDLRNFHLSKEEKIQMLRNTPLPASVRVRIEKIIGTNAHKFDSLEPGTVVYMKDGGYRQVLDSSELEEDVNHRGYLPLAPIWEEYLNDPEEYDCYPCTDIVAVLDNVGAEKIKTLRDEDEIPPYEYLVDYAGQGVAELADNLPERYLILDASIQPNLL